MNAPAAAAAATLLALSVASAGREQSRPPIVETVDLAVAPRPVVVPSAGRANLVYELHITNFTTVPVTLSRIEVLGSGRSPRPVADYRGNELRRRIGRPGLRRDHAEKQVIAAGMRAVIYFWIELPEGSAIEAIRHRLEIDVNGPDGPRRSVVEGGATQVAAETPVALAPPLAGGPWVAIYDPLLVGGHRTAIYAVNGRARIPGRFAIDWVRLTPGGTLERQEAHAKTWNGYGTDVLAVAAATVAAAMDDIPDNAGPPAANAAPIPVENASGNYVALDLGNGRFVFYEHLARGTITVKPGDRVRAGQVIGKLGYSGSSSIGPHLHFHVGDANATLAAEGLPFVLTGFNQLGAFASIDALIRGESFVADRNRRPNPRRMERPAPNAVVMFGGSP